MKKEYQGGTLELVPAKQPEKLRSGSFKTHLVNGMVDEMNLLPDDHIVDLATPRISDSSTPLEEIRVRGISGSCEITPEEHDLLKDHVISDSCLLTVEDYEFILKAFDGQDSWTLDHGIIPDEYDGLRDKISKILEGMK